MISHRLVISKASFAEEAARQVAGREVVSAPATAPSGTSFATVEDIKWNARAEAFRRCFQQWMEHVYKGPTVKAIG
jgi:hypothetical protein